MLRALNTAATGMDAQTKNVETISNNIANADTTSFKKSRVEFQDLLYQNVKDPGAATSATTLNPTGVQFGAGVQVSATAREHTQGSLRSTDRPLDMAIMGDGFFSVQMPNGNLAYTRDGSFNVDGDGRLITSQGLPLQPEITLPPDTQSVNIGQDGIVSVSNAAGENNQVGQIQLSTFVNPSGLQAEGGNLYLVSQGSGNPVPSNPGDQGVGRIQQKYLETSNVKPVTEMTDMVRAQRIYELNSKVITTTDQMMSTLNQLK